MGAFFSGLFSSATSFLGGAKYWLIALAISTVAAFSYGYYKGNDAVVTKVINASDAQIASATAAGAKAQSDKDAKDYAANKADSDQRLAAATKRTAALEALLKNKNLLVKHDPNCKVPAAAMHKLNDPDLVGETQ